MQYNHFGVMLDCSRNGVMKPEQIKKFIDILVKIGYNCVGLYMEDTYEIEGEPLFGYLRGRYTKEELRDLDEYAKGKGVELIPYVQTLAHLNGLAKNWQKSYLFDNGNILLCDDERTYEFIDKMFAALSQSFSTRTINIGMDEAFMLGRGKYLDKHGFVPRFDILTKHLSRVNEIAQKYGFQPQIWSDMLFRIMNGGGYYGKGLHIPKEVYEKIPENVELAYWDYYTKDLPTYDDMFAAHFETGRKVWFAGGAWCWRGFAPFNQYTLSSMKPAMQSVIKYNVQDVMITLWGDNGKECSFFSVLPALYTVRQYADGNFNEQRIKDGFKEIFAIDYDDFCALDLPNLAPKFDFNDYPKNPCKCLTYQDPFQGLHDADVAAEGHIPYEKYAQKLVQVAPRLGEFGYLAENMADLCYFLALKAEIGNRTRNAYRSDNRGALVQIVKDYALMIARLQRFYRSLYVVWHKENKDFGWEVQDIRLGGLERRLKTCKRVLEEYLKGERDRIEELEEDILPLGHNVTLFDNNYAPIVTRGTL